MKFLKLIIFAVLLITATTIAQPTHIIITNDGDVTVGEIIETTEKAVIFKDSDGEVSIISVEDIREIKHLKGKTEEKAVESNSKPSKFSNLLPPLEGKYIKIPLSPQYVDYTKIGLFFSDFTYKTENVSNIYEDDVSMGIGINFIVDYSPLVGFVFRYIGSSQIASGVDSIGWFNGDSLDVFNYKDVKWSHTIFYMGPRFHYQWSLLNAYFDMGLAYSSVGQSGELTDDNSAKHEYSKGMAAYGFGYNTGVELITPFGVSAYIEIGNLNVESGNRDIGVKWVGGGFNFLLD